MNKKTPSRVVYQFLYNRKKLKSDILRRMKLLNLENSEWYPECVKYYADFDVRDKYVFDIGADFGTSPMYFLSRGARHVYGFSLDKQYFRNPKYTHFVGAKNYPVESLPLYFIPKEIISLISEQDIVVKVDAEGWEWVMSVGIFMLCSNWIIALHYPILNPFLHEWIKQNGEFVGSPSDSTKDGDEFAIYKKRGANDA